MTKSCTQCGRCCTNADFMERIGISKPDTDRWQREGRTDILARLGEDAGWKSAGPCPFLVPAGDQRLVCSIYETRPATCREYPMAVAHMRWVDCEMLEPGDTDEDVARFMAKSEGEEPQPSSSRCSNRILVPSTISARPATTST